MKYTKDIKEARKWQKNEGGVIRYSEKYQMYYISIF